MTLFNTQRLRNCREWILKQLITLILNDSVTAVKDYTKESSRSMAYRVLVLPLKNGQCWVCVERNWYNLKKVCWRRFDPPTVIGEAILLKGKTSPLPSTGRTTGPVTMLACDGGPFSSVQFPPSVNSPPSKPGSKGVHRRGPRPDEFGYINWENFALSS